MRQIKGNPTNLAVVVKILRLLWVPVTVGSLLLNVVFWLYGSPVRGPESVSQDPPEKLLNARLHCTAVASKGNYRAYSFPARGSEISFSVAELLKTDNLKFQTKHENGDVDRNTLYLGNRPVIVNARGCDVRLVSTSGTLKTTIEISKTNGSPGTTMFVVMEDGQLFGGITLFNCEPGLP